MKKYLGIFSILLALLIIAGSAAGCKNNDTSSGTSSRASSKNADDFFNPDEGSSASEEAVSDEESGQPAISNVSSKAVKVSSNAASKTTSSKPVTVDEVSLPTYKFPNKNVVILAHTEQDDALLKEKYGLSVTNIIVSTTQLVSRFVGMATSGQAPDLVLANFNSLYITKGYVKQLDEYIDFGAKLWQDVSYANNYFTQNNKHYYAVSSVAKNDIIWYNKTLFQEAGREDPGSMFKKGTWNWNTYRDAIKNLTVDANRDGTPEQYGLAISRGDEFLYASNTHFVTLNAQGDPVNSIGTAATERSMNFYASIYKDYKIYPKTDEREAFAKGNIAMVSGFMWYRGTYKTQLKNGTACFVPTPKDPSADKHYVAEEISGWFIGSSAKNPEGGAAYLACKRYATIDPELKKKGFKTAQEEFGWNQECEDTVDLIAKNCTGLPQTWLTFMPDTYSEPFSKIREGKTWSSIVAEYSPKIDTKIAEFNKTIK